MAWKATFFDTWVKDETLKFPTGVLANYLHVVEIIEELGPPVGKPYTAPMGKVSFEIRAKGEVGIGRPLFIR